MSGGRVSTWTGAAMKSMSAVLVAVLLTFGSGFANAQSANASPVGAQPSDQAAAQPAQPSSAAPAETPPAPPAQLPPPPQQPVQNGSPQAVAPTPEMAQSAPTAAAQ